MYTLIVLLNINVAMAGYGAGISTGYQSVTDAMLGTGEFPIDDEYKNSLYMTVVLGTLIFLG